MNRIVALLFVLLAATPSRADFWGGDLPLLTQIVANTLQTLHQLSQQTQMMEDEMNGIKDKIYRIETIARVVQPSTWGEWKNPAEALRKLQTIYYTLPKEYTSAKSDTVAAEISRAMSMISQISDGAHSSFLSGKELERRGADASPGVAQKLTASGVGSLIAMEAQTQVIQSHITSLLSQMLADANEKENRAVVSRAAGFSGIHKTLGADDGKFSTHVVPFGSSR